LKIVSGGASLTSRSRLKAREEAVRIATYEAVQKVAELLMSQLQGDVKDSLINSVRKEIWDNPDSFVSNFKVIDEHEDMVMDEIWVTVKVEVNEGMLKRILQREGG